MKRKIISIDDTLCDGCGLCVRACHEGAIQLVDGKAKLISDSYCDGLGDCLPACPAGAIQIVEREAAAYDEAAVAARTPPPFAGCPGMRTQSIPHKAPPTAPASDAPPASQLTNWPIQIKLVNIHAPYLQNADLLIAADCAGFAFPDLHRRFLRDKVTLIGCPKLDDGDYAEKLAALLQANDIKSLTVLRMEVPCCGGLAHAAQRALHASGKTIPCQVVTISTNGEILEE